MGTQAQSFISIKTPNSLSVIAKNQIMKLHRIPICIAFNVASISALKIVHPEIPSRQEVETTYEWHASSCQESVGLAELKDIVGSIKDFFLDRNIQTYPWLLTM